MHSPQNISAEEIAANSKKENNSKNERAPLSAQDQDFIYKKVVESDYFDNLRFLSGKFYCFKVNNGSTYVSFYSSIKLTRKKDKKSAYAAILLRKKAEHLWVIRKITTRNLKWKCMDIANKWRCQKLGIEFVPSQRYSKRLSEEERINLSNRMLDLAGRRHNLPVFDHEFQCASCGHEWAEVTYEHGVFQCPECYFTESF